MASKRYAEADKRELPEAERPYPIPDNWRWVTLRSINRYRSHTVTPVNQPDTYFELYSVPSAALDYPEVVLGSEIGSAKQSVQKNDVLLCKINPRINRVWKVSQHTHYDLLASSEWIIIRNSQINSDFLLYCLRSPYFREFMLSQVSGVGGSLMRAQPKYVESYPVPLPPLAEQGRIVARIESLFSALDEVRKKVQAALHGLELWKTAVLREAFAGKLTEAWRDSRPQAAPWSKRALKDCGEWRGGGTPSMARPEYWENGDLLWITPKDMKSDLIEDTLLHINMLAADNSSAKYIEKPSVLFVTRSGILRRTLPIAAVKVPFTVNQDLKALSPYDDIDADYLFWACKSYEKAILRTCVKDGTTVESVNAKALAAFEIPVAPKEEQLVIAACLNRLFKRQQAVSETAETVLRQIDAMKKVILGRAFRGELGTNDPAEKSADF